MSGSCLMSSSPGNRQTGRQTGRLCEAECLLCVYSSQHPRFFSVSSGSRRRELAMAAVVSYSPPWWVNVLHRLPHFNFMLEQTSSDFHPDDWTYQQSILLLGGVALACLALDLLFLLFYSICLCCRRSKREDRPGADCCCTAWCVIIATLVCSFRPPRDGLLCVIAPHRYKQHADAHVIKAGTTVFYSVLAVTIAPAHLLHSAEREGKR
ncbi:Protein tweety 3 [Liparis tanakae]|uniref:Protein tweety homolog n=1 Tax=Liparis tanakae TaxID=230148 RepID=A0A4Z2HQI2_9TELE|nr:Protein tweety 3 [Liparis tanakae]